MIMASAAVFLLPLAGAIAGAAWIRSGAIKQLLAVLAGFAAGAAAAAIITRWIKPRPKEIS